MKKILLVGAGLYNAVIANELKKYFDVTVIDKRSHIAGNIYTEKRENINVHVYGAHIFHTSNKKVWDYINKFAEFNNYINSPIAIYKDELYNLPFNMNTFSKLFNVKTPFEAMEIIEKEKKEANISSITNLEEQAISLVGKTIYEKLVKDYTAKQWGRDCKELPSFIIKRLPVRFTFDNNYFNDRYQGIPLGGYTKIIEKMLEGTKVILNTDFFSQKDKYLKDFDYIVYTGSIDQFYDYKFGKLDYRTVYFETETLSCPNYQGNAVVNYTSKEVPFTRIIEHKHFEFDSTSPKTIISKEFSKTFEEDDEPYYPVNDSKNNSLYDLYLNEAKKEEKVFFGGRLGLYKYFDMDDTIEKAFEFINFFKEKYLS